MHRVQPLAKPALRNCDLNNVRKLTFAGFELTAALISERFEHWLPLLSNATCTLMAIGLK